MCASSALDASGRPFVVMAGGLDANDNVSGDLIIYDVMNKMKSTLQLAVPRFECVTCRVDDVILIAAGCNNNTAPIAQCRIRTVESYNVTSRELSTLRGGLSSARLYVAAAETRTHCVFLGGAGTLAFKSSSAVDAFDFRTRSWTYLNLSESRYFPAAVGIRDTVVVMGSDIGSSPEVRYTIEEIDLSVARPISRIVHNISVSAY